jgi:hypothetical protein
MASTVFYSWQSDLPNNINRGFIEDALEKAIKQLNKELTVDEAERNETLKLDKDTQDLPGSPPIVQSIFEKISKAVAFIPDVTFVAKTGEGRLVPNPNVLIEYGWALRDLGHSRIIPVMNTAFGDASAETLPFDMRHLRWPIRYHLQANTGVEERARAKEDLVKQLAGRLQAMVLAGLLEVLEKRPERPNYEDLLKTWHDTSHAKYLQYLGPARQWSVPGNTNHYQLSYLLCRPKDAKEIPHRDFLPALREAHEEVKKRVWTGWSMFYVFDRAEIKPYIEPDNLGGEDVDVVETNLMNFEGMGLPDYWRLTRTGYATMLRLYREDDSSRAAPGGFAPGKWFSPRWLVQEVAELTAHAAAMWNVFGDCDGVEFRCSWYGLKNRVIADSDPSIHWDRRVSRADFRTSRTRADKDLLFARWPTLVASLTNPITMLFDGMETNEEWVQYIAPMFRKL